MTISSIISSPSDWADDSVLLLNEPIRQGLVTMERLLHSLQPFDLDRIKLFFLWFSYYSHFIQIYLQIQGGLYLPWVQGDMALDPFTVLEQLLEVEQMELKFHTLDCVGVTSDCLDRLRESCILLRKEVLAILDKVDVLVPGLLRSNRTHSDSIPVHRAILKKCDKYCYWVLQSLKERPVSDGFGCDLNSWQKMKYATQWRVQYKKYNVELVDKILGL